MISLIGRSPNVSNAGSSSQRFIFSVTSARPSRACFVSSSSATSRKVLPPAAAILSSRRRTLGSVPLARSLRAAWRRSRASARETVIRAEGEQLLLAGETIGETPERVAGPADEGVKAVVVAEFVIALPRFRLTNAGVAEHVLVSKLNASTGYQQRYQQLVRLPTKGGELYTPWANLRF